MIQRIIYISIFNIALMFGLVPLGYAESWENSEHFPGDGEFSYYEFHNNPGHEVSNSGDVSGLAEGEGIPEFNRDKKRGKWETKRTKYFFTAGINGSFRFDSALGTSDSYTNILGGVTGSLRFGLKGGDFDWSLEQQFGHIWGLKIRNGSADMTRYDGSTFIEMNQTRPLKHYFCMHYTIGLGLIYSMPHTGEPGAYRDTFAIDDSGTTLAISVKLGVGIIWYFTQRSGIGLNLNYLVGVDIASYILGQSQNSTTVDVTGGGNEKLLVEMLQPGVVWITRF